MKERNKGQEIEEENSRGRSRPPDRSSHFTRQRKHKVPVLMVPLAVFLAVAITAAFFYIKDRAERDAATGLSYESNIVEGDIPGKSREERQRELDSIVEEGMLAMTINATPSGKTTGLDRNINWLIENPSNQGKLIRVEITRDDTGEMIYETGAIPPGNYVESAPLKEELPPGTYSCTAKFYAYKETDESFIGQAAAQIRLVLYE